MADKYDVLILGSGQAGNPLSTAFVQAGRRVALVERALVAGTCINYGCTPTKTMVASAQRAWAARHAAELGVETGEVRVNMQQVRARKRSIGEQVRSASEKRFARGEPELERGEARIVGPREIAVTLRDGGERRMAAEIVVIDTGAAPHVPEVPGLQQTPFLDNVSVTELDAVPEHLVVLGGGYIAVEFGQMFRRFGSHVTIIQRGSHLLPREDEDVSTAVESLLREDGLVLALNANPARVEGNNAGVAVHLESGGTITGSHLLVATGRVPNTAALDLQQAGIRTGSGGFIVVDDQLRTNVEGVYAVGDVKGGPQFTHVSYDDFRILRDNLIDGKRTRRVSDRPTVYVVYLDPQLGRVGLTEAEARSSGRRIRVACMPVSSIARAIEVNETRGLLKAIVDAETEQILGAAVLAPEGGELMSMLQIAMMGRCSYRQLADAVFAHPTYAEALNNLWSHLRP